MLTKKIILSILLSATMLNISGMKREREENITEKTSHQAKKVKLTPQSINLTIPTNPIITNVEQLPAHQKITRPKRNTTRFFKTIENENNAPDIKETIAPIKIFITPTVQQKNDFCDAIENGKFNDVEKFLTIGMDPNITFENGYSALELTTQIKKEKMAMKIATSLITRGAQVNPENGNGPLPSAAAEGKAKLVDHLIKNGALINQQSGIACSTPLHLTIDANSPETTECLLSHGANKRIKDVYNNTPLAMILHNTWLNNEEKKELITALNNQRKLFLNRHMGNNPIAFITNRQQTGKSDKFLLKK